ncbi:MAG: DnaA regulatory inactivator Hda [Gammaproteobacteria bacterium]
MHINGQLPIEFHLDRMATFANYVVGSNTQLVTLLKQQILQPRETCIYFWGTSGIGRTHLLNACCHYAEEQRVNAIYLPLSHLKTYSPGVLDEVAEFSVICIDDIEMIAANRQWEEALFYVYNQAQAKQHLLIISALASPMQLALSLPDLQSRLTAGAVFHMQELTDEDKIILLKLKAEQKGILLSDQLAEFFIKRCERTVTQLIEVLDEVAAASLQAQRRLTIPFVKQILNV